MKFRKRPVVIDAVRVSDIIALATASYAAERLPDWVIKGFDDRLLFIQPLTEVVMVHTLEGDMRAEKQDWLIRGVRGELYPCKPDIFEATYEKVE